MLPVEHNPVLRETAHTLIPVIFLYALYVQFHSDFGPGGGFQAGVIFSTGPIIHGLVHGFALTRRFFPPWLAQLLACLGVLIYIGVGYAGLMSGGNFLDYAGFAASAADGEHYGILLVELGVAITLVGTITTLLYSFTDGEDEKTDVVS